MSAPDTIVVGAGLAGLWLSHRLRANGEKIVLLEAKETLGGRYRRQSHAQPFGVPDLEFYPGETSVLETLRWAQGLAPAPFGIEVTEHRPRIYDDARWRPFAGFGETNFSSVDQLGLFSATSEAVISPGIEHLTRTLVEQLPLEAMTMNEVTAITKTEDGLIEVTTNGDKTFKAPCVIFTADPRRLGDLVPGELLSAKHRTRLAKATNWTSVTLELTHQAPLVEENAIMILSHNSKDFEPVVARGFGITSRWMTLVPDERGLDHEFIAQTIRHIKRQIKRPFPTALEGGVSEKIFVSGHAFGQLSLKTKEPFRLPEFPGLYLSNHALATTGGALGSLEMARAVETELLGADSGRGTSVIVQP